LNKTKYDKNDGSEEITLGDTVVGEESNFWDDNLILKDALSILDEREQYIMDLRYNKDMAQHEVADVIGVSQVQISRIERRIFVKLREYLGLPTEIPKVEKPKKPKSTTPKRSGPQGDRDKAIHLLKTSTLNYPDISTMTGVPLGSLYSMGREHRPQVLRDIVKNRATNKKGELNVYEA
jgi:DNA-binding XRE family transcriptional regulator